MCVHVCVCVCVCVHSSSLHLTPAHFLQAFKLIDDLLGEISGLRERVDSVSSSMNNMEKTVSSCCHLHTLAFYNRL